MTKTLDLAWQTQGITPTLLTGADAQKMYNALPEQARVGLRYDEKSMSVIGSTPFASAILDVEAQKYGARTPNLRDLSRPEVMRIAKDKHYIDSRNLVVRSRSDSSWEKNNPLLTQIYELAEQKEGSVKDGFMIENYTFAPDSDSNNKYGLKIVAQPDFKVTQDERLLGHNGESFSEVDGSGLPIFKRSGNRTWYAKKDGLSGLYLYGGLALGSDYGALADSSDSGRVVFLK